MAQRSARARVKLDKITSKEKETHSYQQHPAGVTKPATFNPYTGLLTPAASSVGTGSSSSRHSFSFNYKPSSSSVGANTRKSAIRSFLEQSDRVRRTLEDRLSRAGSGSNRRDVLGGMGAAWENMGSMKQWEGGGKIGEGGSSTGMGTPATRVLSSRSSASKRDKADHRFTADQDNDLWFHDGDTLVYLAERWPHYQRPGEAAPPSYRIKSQWLRETESSFLLASCHDRMAGQNRPATPPGPSSSLTVDDPSIQRVDSNLQKTMSLGESCRYDIYFPPPFPSDKAGIMKHNLATRNFLALLADKPLVGPTLGQTLIDLVDRLDVWVPEGQPDPMSMSPMSDNVRRVLDYLLRREFDDMRNSPELAAGMLVFAERYQIVSIWQEAFVHCVGMLGRLEGTTEYKEISHITQAFMDRASLDMTVRLSESDKLLETFDFSEMWPVTGGFSPPARASFDKFQKWLVKHYQQRYGSWPPSQDAIRFHGGSKFTRIIYRQLEQDFGGLYDYLVDSDVFWDRTTSQRPVLFSPQKQHFRADLPGLPITDMILEFDKQHKYPPAPLPYPLLPSHILFPSSQTTVPTARHHFLQKPRLTHASVPHNQAAIALALSECTNIQSLHRPASPNQLVDAFRALERQESLPPRDARLGRWLLIYGVLQTLASIVPDAKIVRWSDGVEYFLNAKLRGTPPWKPVEDPGHPGVTAEDDDGHVRSYCWRVAEERRVRRVRSAPGHAGHGASSWQDKGLPRLPSEWESEGEEGDNEDSGDEGRTASRKRQREGEEEREREREERDRRELRELEVAGFDY